MDRNTIILYWVEDKKHRVTQLYVCNIVIVAPNQK